MADPWPWRGSIPYVAEGVVLAVVDPGVGTARRAIAVEVADGAGVLVGPDNGLLAPAVAIVGGAERAVELTNTDYHLAAPGATFAGRDVFAPVAAHLCNGVDLTEFGPLLDADVLMPGMVALPREEADGLHAEVLWVDRFGNCQLNIGPDDLDAARRRVVDRDRRRAPRRARGHVVRRPGAGGGRVGPRLAGDVRAGDGPAIGGSRASLGHGRRGARRGDR